MGIIEHLEEITFKQKTFQKGVKWPIHHSQMSWAEWQYKMEMNMAWDINVAWNNSSERCELLHSFQEEFYHPLSSLTEMKSEAHLSLALHSSLLSAYSISTPSVGYTWKGEGESR